MVAAAVTVCALIAPAARVGGYWEVEYQFC